MLENAEEFTKANPLEKCFLIIENQLCGYLNSDLLSSKNTCVVSFEDYYLNPEKYIKKFETLLDTSRTDFTSNEILKANLPIKKRQRYFLQKSKYDF